MPTPDEIDWQVVIVMLDRAIKLAWSKDGMDGAQEAAALEAVKLAIEQGLSHADRS